MHFLSLHHLYQRWNRVGSPGSIGSRFVWIRPDLKVIRVWLGLDHVSCKIKKARYESTMTAAAATFASWATPTFQNNDFACCNCTGSSAPYFFSAHACYNCHLKLSQSHAHYCCRSSTIAVCQGIFTCSILIACMSHFHLYKPRCCVYKLTGSHTYQSIVIFTCLSWVYIARYLKCVLTQFLSVFHSLPIRVTSRSDPDCYLGQQLWPGFNADLYTILDWKNWFLSIDTKQMIEKTSSYHSNSHPSTKKSHAKIWRLLTIWVSLQ